MKPEFNRSYELLYKEYPYEIGWFPPPRRFYPSRSERDLVQVMLRTIDKATGKIRLRPDAKYFLLLNFHSMVVKPWMINSQNQEANYEVELKRMKAFIRSDIQKIIKESAKAESNLNDGQISGHQIMTTIDKLWKQLKTTKFEIWG